MKKTIFSLLIVLVVSGCSTFGSEFSCNRTAFDKCMTIEQVNTMAERKERIYSEGHSIKKINNARKVWLSSWVDKEGVIHNGQYQSADVQIKG